MQDPQQEPIPCAAHRSLQRRHCLGLGVAALSSLWLPHARAADAANGAAPSAEPLQQDRIEQILQARGKMHHGVLRIGVNRKDLDNVHGAEGMHVLPAWQLNHSFYFQGLGGGQAIMNMDMCLTPSELMPVMDRMLRHGIIVQAEHQHFFDMSPMSFFIHGRAKGDALQIARGLAAAMQATRTPLPQKPPSSPQTPFDVEALGRILGDANGGDIGEDGTVAFHLPRREAMMLGGVRISPWLNVDTNIHFQPLDAQGHRAAVAPDFSMIASEVQPVLREMRSQGYTVGCLYNQETDEQPQLYFSHQMKLGEPLALAREIRKGLDRMNLRL